VASIEAKMRENHLHWFGHIQRRPKDVLLGELRDGGMINWIEVEVGLRRYR
jgi:hypothetical protein